MHVSRFDGDYAVIAPLFDMPSEQLRARDDQRHQPFHRWLAWDEDELVGAATSGLRPDNRLFLQFRGEVQSFRALTEAAHEVLQSALYTTVDLDDREALDAFERAAFLVEVVNERFRIRFDRALEYVARAWVPTGYSIRSAADVDLDRLFTLDNTLRQDVLGTDGWRGNRAWFREEITHDPAFDPSTYLVGIDDASGEYAGLIRIWRNSTGPRLGLLAVLRQYRNTLIAASLLKQALVSAATWGFESFSTETSPANPVTFPRMTRVGAVSCGRSAQLRRP